MKKQKQHLNQQILPKRLALSILRKDYLSRSNCVNQESNASSSTTDLENNRRNDTASRNNLSSILYQNYPSMAVSVKNRIGNNKREKAVEAVGTYNSSPIYILPPGCCPLISVATTHDPYQVAPNVPLVNFTNPSTPRGSAASNQTPIVTTPDQGEVHERVRRNREARAINKTTLNFGS